MTSSHDPRSPEARAAFAAFLDVKGELRRTEAVLCALCWLGGDARTPVRPAAITALYPKHFGRPLGSPAQALRHLTDRALAKSLGDAHYRITPLGRVVVEALPDRAEVGRLRGLRVAPPAPRRPGLDRV